MPYSDFLESDPDLPHSENAASASADKPSKSSSGEILVAFIFRHDLTDGEAERSFSKELVEKVQQVKNRRKEIILAVDPYSIVISDIMDFILEEFGMTIAHVEKNQETSIAQMIMLADGKVCLDSDKIVDLIAGGKLKQVPSPKDYNYIVDYIFLRPLPKLSSLEQQQKAIDALLKNLPSSSSSSSSISAISPPTLSSFTIFPASSHLDTCPAPVTSFPILPDTGVEKLASESKSANSTLEGEGKDTGRKKRGRANMHQSDITEMAERGPLGEPDAKRLRRLVPNLKLAPNHNGQGSVGVGGTPQVFGNYGGAVTVGNSQSRFLSLSNSPTPYPVLPIPLPLMAGINAIQTAPHMPVSSNRRTSFTARELTAISHLALGRKKLTITFEDDDGSIQTICVENRS